MASETRRALAAAIALALTMVCAPASAQQQPSAADRETARALMAEGRDKRDAGDLAGALRAFDAADSIMHVPTTGLEVARTQERMGLLVEARETLLAVLRLPAHPNDPAPFAEARKNAETLDADLARRIPSVVVEATSELPGPITVSIDEQPIPANLLGLPRKMNPGKHVVVARVGGDEAREEITLGPSETKNVKLEVKKAPAVVAQATPEEASAAEHGSRRPIPLVSWIGFGVGAVGLGVGSAAGIISLSKTSDAGSQCIGNECPRSVQSELDSANTFATISNIGFGVAIAGAAVGLVGLFVLRPPSEAKSARITLTGNGVAGVF